MTRWWRAYSDARNDPKLMLLSPEMFRAWFILVCLAADNDGEIKSASDAAFALRVSDAKAQATIAYLAGKGLFDHIDGGYFEPHNWSGRQYKTDVTDPTNASRQKRWRNAHRNGDRNGNSNAPQNDQIQNTDTEQSRKKENAREARLSPGWPDDYAEVFWEAFPNKVGKQDALRKLERVARSGTISFSEMMEALHRYATKTDDRPFCNPATWIHQGRWTDVPATNGNAKRTIQQAAADQLAMFRSITGKDRIGNEARDPPVRMLPARGR